MKETFQTNQSGFTLLEMLVSLALFTIVITMSVGSLLVLIDANAKARNMQALMTNLAFALDSMTRDIRTGYDYSCDKDHGEGQTSDCPSSPSTDGFSFTESGNSLTVGLGNNRIAYQLQNNRIQRNLAGSGWQPITSEDIEITELSFYVSGAADELFADGDTEPPTVTIFVSGEAGDVEVSQTSFSLQTTVVQRREDY